MLDDEPVARLLHSGIVEPEKQRLRREELFHKGDPETVKNVCGDEKGSAGASLTRCGVLDDDALRSRSQDYAATKEGRRAEGAIVGTAGAVRAIRSTKTPDFQVAFVYDDPTTADVGHCVIRCLSVGRAEEEYIRSQILAALGRRVEQQPSP